MNKELLTKLFKDFNIVPKTYSIYEQAFTHISYSSQHKLNYDYETLEFLGDAVLDKLIAEFLYKKYPNMTAGELSTNHSLITKGKTLTIAAENLGFRDLIIYGGTMRGREDITDRILEDSFEAFIGAIYLDQGEKKVFEILKKSVINYYLIDMLNKDLDFKTVLNSYFLKHKEVKFEYKISQDNVKKMFKAEIFIDGHKSSIGYGKKIKDAEGSAAKIIYHRLQKQGKINK